MNENELTKQIIHLIRSCGGFIYRTHRPGQWACEKGVSDLAGIWQGKPLYIEVKGPKARTTQDQLNFLANAIDHGAIGFIATSVDMVVDQLGLNVLL